VESQNCLTYRRDECAVFLKTTERYGGLSNMAGGYPLSINGIRVLTSEALYQACRFPHRPDVQKMIIGQASPMTAKMKSKPHRKDSRPDWDAERVKIMRWCLRVKLVQHWEQFADLLLSTEGDQQIVEESYRDQFWGAKPIDSETLCGANILGQLLVELREQLRDPDANRLWLVEPPPLPQFLLLGRQIGTIEGSKPKSRSMPIAAPLGLTTSGQIPPESTTISDMIVNAEDPSQARPQVAWTHTPTIISSFETPLPATQDHLPHQLSFEGLSSQDVPQKAKSKKRYKRRS
jgi:ribA/ribD-fused uncharacterized protein